MIRESKENWSRIEISFLQSQAGKDGSWRKDEKQWKGWEWNQVLGPEGFHSTLFILSHLLLALLFTSKNLLLSLPLIFSLYPSPRSPLCVQLLAENDWQVVVIQESKERRVYSHNPISLSRWYSFHHFSSFSLSQNWLSIEIGKRVKTGTREDAVWRGEPSRGRWVKLLNSINIAINALWVNFSLFAPEKEKRKEYSSPSSADEYALKKCEERGWGWLYGKMVRKREPEKWVWTKMQMPFNIRSRKGRRRRWWRRRVSRKEEKRRKLKVKF